MKYIVYSVNIQFNPRISGGFVFHVMKDSKIAPLINNLKAADFTDEEIHEIVKNIIIVSFRDYEVDINEKINVAKKSGRAEQDQVSWTVGGR